MVLKAKIFDKDIGVLSQKDGGYFFEYFDTFVQQKLEISPFYLPLSSRVYSGREFMATDMIPSVFYDSLPDSFGSYLMSSYFEVVDGSFEAMKNPLRKLAYMGDRAIGAIEYEPALIDKDKDSIAMDLKEYIQSSRKVISGDVKDVIKILTAHPSPGGARPKAFVGWDRKIDHLQVGTTCKEYEPWIVKFYENDKHKKHTTKIEYVYFQIAKEIGIDIPQFDYILQDDEFHFAIKRFDRQDGKKLHIHTLSSLLNKRFDERGYISYEELFKATLALTKSIKDVKEAYKRMVFNIIGQNCDDHGKNFSFLMDESGDWKFSPAYDLNYSFGRGVYKEHFLSLNKKREEFEQREMIDIAVKNGISSAEAKRIIEETLDAFSLFPRYAKEIDLRVDLEFYKAR